MGRRRSLIRVLRSHPSSGSTSMTLLRQIRCFSDPDAAQDMSIMPSAHAWAPPAHQCDIGTPQQSIGRSECARLACQGRSAAAAAAADSIGEDAGGDAEQAFARAPPSAGQAEGAYHPVV